jgi:hypothetical protein
MQGFIYIVVIWDDTGGFRTIPKVRHLSVAIMQQVSLCFVALTHTI